jgi:regulatory protein
MTRTVTPHQRAISLLASRPYSIKELRAKLVHHGASAEEADGVVQRLCEAGVLDDAKYAMAYARSKLNGSGASERRILQELARKGVQQAVVKEAIEHLVADEEIDTTAVLERVARKKLASLGDLEPLVVRRRLYAFLARRGYDLDEVQTVVQRLLVR